MKTLYRLIFLFTGIALLVVSCKPKEEKKQGSVSGTLKNSTGTLVYLERFDEKGEYILDSAITDAQGNFRMKNMAVGKDYYALRTDPTNLVFLLISGEENVEITGDAKNMEHSYTVKGSKDSELIRLLKNFDGRLSDSLNNIYSAFRENHPGEKDSAGAALQKHYAEEMGSFAKEFISQNPKSLVSLSATRYLNQQKDLPVFESLLASLSQENADSKYVKDFATMVADLKKLPPGSAAPEIKLNTPEGKQVALSSLKGKTVLIDFWASWCGPCRKETPHVAEMYRKFKDKNFEILGVSLDENLESWKGAIRNDRMSWPQVSELKKWDSEVVKLYRVDAIPYTVLVDKEGKIIAKGLTGLELEQKLIEVL